ncbi:MAG: SpoIID/LytB domain-containing protein [Defluviitaleaceae bacterium]|nr:SpoIID/LytB domain-containing protein [Defluviitaleaceae bacterium]
MDKRILLAMFAMLISILFAACSPNGDMPPDDDGIVPFVRDGAPREDGPIASTIRDDMPISRAIVAKMIALTFMDAHEIAHTHRNINFADTSATLWHDRYINTAVALGHLNGQGGRFYPDGPLTLEQAQAVLDRLDPNNPIRIQLTEENRHLAISYALWVNLYMQLMENISRGAGIEGRFGLVEENVIVLITPQFNSQLPHGHIITNMGHFTAAGLSFDQYLDHEVSILRRGREIIAILGMVSETPTIRNAYVVSKDAESITIFAGGAQRTYAFDTVGLPQGRIADVSINGRAAEHVHIFEHGVSGVVREVTGGYVDIYDIGRIPLHPVFGIYNALGPVTLGSIDQITIGYDTADFILREGHVAAIIVMRRPAPEHIRVVLSTSGFNSRVHQSVSLQSETGLVIHTDDGMVEIPPNEVLRLSATENAHLIERGRITIVPNGEDGMTQISSISRNWPDGQSPRYRGILEISRRTDGFVIVNQLSLEQYLYAVIPSEMPASFGLEAAKVQAVTARSYAYNAIFANRFYMYGANVDDSVASQVYANFPETQTAITAVRETQGRVLTHDGEVISANFFSTSSGHTTNSGDVWINGSTWEFDRPTPPYLTGTPQYLSGDFGNLSIEANARAFFTNTDIASFDDNSPWFRWNFQLSRAQLTQIIGQNLPGLANASPHLFQVPDTPPFPPQFVTSIGEFQYMEIVSRGQGGNIRELLITGAQGSVLVRTEYAIRRLLTPSTPDGILLNRHNAAPITNHFILPSTFMVFDETSDGLAFFGGGFGHGVGMSQHGVYGMIQRGHGYEDILAHFYPGTQLATLSAN